jgi:hypothetical protein
MMRSLKKIQMSEEGDRLVFPVQTQQKRVRTFGWSNFKSSYGFDEYLCALAERYIAVGLTQPTITIGNVSFSIVSEADRALVANELQGKSGEVLHSIVQQIHTSVLGLAGYYYDKFSIPIQLDAMLGWGLVESGATWPAGFEPLDVAFGELRYTKSDLPDRSYPVDFTDRLVALAFPYVQSVVPATSDGKLSSEAVAESFVSSEGVLDQTGYQTNQGISVKLEAFRRWCNTGFFQPCFEDASTKVLSAESGISSETPPEMYSDLELKEKVVSFNLSDLCSSLRYVLTGTATDNVAPPPIIVTIPKLLVFLTVLPMISIYKDV